jgi:serine/threonine protein phosphatase 1
MENRAKTFVVGDIHGSYKALKQVLTRSGFRYDTDTLIQLGDIVDGWGDSYECVEELLKVNNLISIRGNHDEWFTQFLNTSKHPIDWGAGGLATKNSYEQHCDTIDPDFIPRRHRDFFNRMRNYYIDTDNRIFVHAGFEPSISVAELHEIEPSNFYWNRSLLHMAMGVADNSEKLVTVDGFNEIYVGHVATTRYSKTVTEKRVDHITFELEFYVKTVPITEPIRKANLINLDTGAGGNGKLTIMDVDTKEYWQSDLSKNLYQTDDYAQNIID